MSPFLFPITSPVHSHPLITQFVEGNVSGETLDQIRLLAMYHPTLQRRGYGGLQFIDTGTSVNKYFDEQHGILLTAPEHAVPRGVLAEELQHAIDFASGYHSPQRIAAVRRIHGKNYNDVWHRGVFLRIAEAIDSPQPSIFHHFLTLEDADAFRRAAAALPR